MLTDPGPEVSPMPKDLKKWMIDFDLRSLTFQNSYLNQKLDVKPQRTNAIRRVLIFLTAEHRERVTAAMVRIVQPSDGQ